MAIAPNPLESFVQDIARKTVREELAKLSVTQRLVDVRGAAEYLGLSVPAVRNKMAAGLLKRVKIDGLLRFDLRDLDALIEGSK